MSAATNHIGYGFLAKTDENGDTPITLTHVLVDSFYGAKFRANCRSRFWRQSSHALVATECYAADGSLGGIVVDLERAVVKVSAEGSPAP